MFAKKLGFEKEGLICIILSLVLVVFSSWSLFAEEIVKEGGDNRLFELIPFVQTESRADLTMVGVDAQKVFTSFFIFLALTPEKTRDFWVEKMVERLLENNGSAAADQELWAQLIACFPQLPQAALLQEKQNYVAVADMAMILTMAYQAYRKGHGTKEFEVLCSLMQKEVPSAVPAKTNAFAWLKKLRKNPLVIAGVLGGALLVVYFSVRTMKNATSL